LTLLQAGEETRAVTVVPKGEGLLVKVGSQEFTMDLLPTAPGAFLLVTGSRSETVHCVRAKGVVHLFLRGAAYRFVEARETLGGPTRASSSGLEAPMPGKVIKIRVSAGESVTKGQEILVVEAMKMENAVRAPRDGVVGKVHVKEGDMVAPGSVLVELG
jgi:biotin carboxyl carrier protein